LRISIATESWVLSNWCVCISVSHINYKAISNQSFIPSSRSIFTGTMFLNERVSSIFSFYAIS
jgi:uncharacterized membrane protein